MGVSTQNQWRGKKDLGEIEKQRLPEPPPLTLFDKILPRLPEWRTPPSTAPPALSAKRAPRPGKTSPPGIDYFFVVEDGQRRLFTHPPQDPRANPLRLEVRLDHPAGESLLFPAMDKVRISGRRL